MMGSNIGIAIITEISTHSSGFGWNHFRIWRRNATHLTIWEIWLAVRANLGSYLDYTMNIHCNQGLFGLHRLNWNPDTPQIQNRSLPWQKLKLLLHNKCISYPKHRKNSECCPGHYLIVNHYSSMSWLKFRNLSVIVNSVTKSLIH